MNKAVVTISALVSINDANNKRDNSVAKVLSSTFSKKEIVGIQSEDDCISFIVANILCIPTLISLFSSLQLYVNGNAVDMNMLK